MARSARDCALLLQAMAGFDPRDAASVDRPVEDFTASIDAGLHGLRVAVPRMYFADGLQPDIESAWRAALQVLERDGAALVDVEFTALEQSVDIGTLIVRSEMSAYHQAWFTARPQDYDPWLHARFASVRDRSAVDLARAQRARDEVRADFRRAFERADVLVVPVMPRTAKRIGDEDPAHLSVDLTYPFNLAGIPALAVPCGFDSQGLPIGIQIAAPAWQEALTLRVGHAYQQSTAWHKQRPPISQGQPA